MIMSKNHKNNPYRKIYEEHHGIIPDGFHIHHLDGNPSNNDISNLIAISPEEHAILHNDEFVKWASIGGKLGGQKSKEEKLGFCGWDFDKRSQENKGRKYSEESKIKKSNTIRALYESGEMIHWTKLYDKQIVSEKIREGDPGKSMRGKTAWNKNKKMQLKDPEQARLRKQAAALNREKFPCENCGRSFDKGNLVKHSKKCKQEN